MALIKWVTCAVTDRDGFDRGQRGWADLRGRPGFGGQWGGWSGGAAHVVGCWADEVTYRAFMDGVHDRIAAGQAGTYESASVRVFSHRLTIGAGLLPDADAAVLRLAHCHVRPDRRDHFVRAQAEVWNPGMSAAPGMVGGAFAERGDAEFLVLTHWRTAIDHARYVADRFPALRERAAAADDLAAVTGALVDLVPAWTVSPPQPHQPLRPPKM
ncbi:DUF4937 domain-containing protein [Virgisporangium aurantiacum]|uniref:DUF4937 domain-containing protein n=1 Tax=Virgisporangium aurantiacum TaxID=175570 RepID=A0A8J3Z572_9ACTN|nr:DUF4937 domain-containing protein [Virgisporangium aurantiacum]GIJ56523.1 hypothetical protein Vau01_040390 [Virgisporangium aurantiacum]